MSTKFSYWLSNKDKTSRKSAGCMTGIFQLFDRQFLLSSREFNGQYHKSPSADVPISLCKQGADYGEFCLEQNLSRSYQEDSRSSMESSTRTSFSSSSRSCSSSLKHRLPKDEPKSYEQSFSSVRSPKNSTKQRSKDTNQSPGFRDSIKESIYKDLKSVSVKEKAKEGVKRNKLLKPVDSPRPIDPYKMKELEESLRILIQLRELPMNFHEVGGSPRFSYDGRIPTDIKQAITQKDKRRLSLDSIEDSLRRDIKSKVNSLLKELEKRSDNKITEASNLHQDHKSNGNYTNIVARLMGLGPINTANESCVKDHEPVKSQIKQESKHGKLMQSTSNSPKSRSSVNPHMKSNYNSSLVVEETQQKRGVEYVEANMKQKIESAYAVIEKSLQKLEFYHNKKDIRALKSPVMVLKPESKSTGITYAKLEVPSGLRKIKTNDSSGRKMESLSAYGRQTPTGKTAKSLNSSGKETSRREGEKSVSPRLQKRKPDQERKSCTVIPSNDLKKSLRKPNYCQQSESLSPSSRIGQKSSKAQPNDRKSHVIHQTKGKTATNVKHKLHQMLPRQAVFVEELEKLTPQLSSPNSVLDASPYQDDLPLSPLSVSSTSNAEDDNLPSDHNLKTIQISQNLKYSQNQANIDTKVHRFISPSSTTDKNNDPDNKYVAEALLASSLLTTDPHLHSMLKQIKLVEPFEAVEKNNSRMLHKQLVYDVVNEILTRKIEAFNSGCQHDHLLEPNMVSLKLLFKELCFEVNYLQSPIDRSLQEDTVFTKDLLRQSNAWERFDSEVPVVVLEIERLILVDLINDILRSMIDVVLETKQR